MLLDLKVGRSIFYPLMSTGLYFLSYRYKLEQMMLKNALAVLLKYLFTAYLDM